MGCCDHDTCVAVVVTCRKAQRRNGHKLVIDADVDSVCSKNACGVTREIPALETAVIADRDGLCAALCEHPAGDALCCLADNPDVHTVCACAECAAKTGSTERKSDRKTLFNGFIITLDVCEFRVQVRVDEIRGEPALVIIKIHSFSPFRSAAILYCLRRSLTDSYVCPLCLGCTSIHENNKLPESLQKTEIDHR